MQALFTTIYTWIQWLFGVVPRSARGSKTLFRVLHYTAVVLITLVLGFLSDRILEALSLDLDVDNEFVKRYWVGVLFLLGYLFVRLLIYLINLLLIRDEPEFRDIDRCWQIGMSELQRAGMDITYLPVFLVNGLTVEDESVMFQSAGMNWKVVAPGFDDRAAVLRFFATDDALFVSLTGVGAASLQRMQRPQSSVSSPQFGGGGGGAPIRQGTLRREDIAVAMQESTAAPAPNFGGGRTLPAGGLKGVLAGINPQPAAPPRAGGPQRTMMPGMAGGAAPAGVSSGAGSSKPPAAVIPRLEPEDRNRSERRMVYLTYLLKRDRAPFCPVNGMLQAVPMSWAERMRDITELTPSIADDLKVLATELEMSSPLIVFYCELEKLPGFEEFLSRCSRQTPQFRDSRAGSRFPAGKPVDNDTARWVVERSLQWFQGWTYSGLAQDVDSPTNSRLYRLLCELNDRRARFEQQLKEIKVSESSGAANSWRLSGCYFVATGNGSSRQGFGTGVLQKAIGEQNDVSWSDKLLRRDGRARMLGWVLLTVGVLLAVANAAAVWWFTQGQAAPPAA